MFTRNCGAQRSQDTYKDASGAVWYYDSETGLYYPTKNFCGVGYTLTQLETFAEEYI